MTALEFEGEGYILAARIAEQGDRKIVWKIGHKDGDFAEATNLYYKRELLHKGELMKLTQNAPSWRFNETNDFQPLEDMDLTEDGDIEYEHGPATDGVEWTLDYIDDWGIEPDTLLYKIWPNMKEQYDERTL
ncbi:hypothetical protein GJ631_01595 [Natronomonas sp. CBA1123]|uniref:hypothetical protein n=1 Tax=Natronomonas sp. CBA1123 TaxID=2668070 RepID=UPI0012E9ED76|nr:hypothetical protein [Natronomonas sp. CBA1123]MUV85310.1 hypothetical protein [Natronomonas sp. CBA1123]